MTLELDVPVRPIDAKGLNGTANALTLVGNLDSPVMTTLMFINVPFCQLERAVDGIRILGSLKILPLLKVVRLG